MWFRHNLKQTLKNPLLWLLSLVLVMAIYGQYQANLKADYDMYDWQIQETTERRNSLSFSLDVFQRYPPDDDQDLQIHAQGLMEDQYQLLSDIILKGWSQDSDIAQESYDYWHKQALLNETGYLDLMLPADQVDLQLARWQEMKDKGLVVLDERSPTNSALFSQQVSQWAFSWLSALAIILFFGFSFLRELASNQIDFYYTLPINRRVILRKYLYELVITSAWMGLLVLLVSMGPVLRSGSWGTFSYPVFVGRLITSSVVAPVWQVILARLLAWFLLIFGLHLIMLGLSYFISKLEANLFISLMLAALLFVQARNYGFQAWNPLSYLLDFEGFFTSPSRLPSYSLSVLLIIGLLVLIYYSDYLQIIVLRNRQQQFRHETSFPASLGPAKRPSLYLEWRKRWQAREKPILVAVVCSLCLVSYSYLVYKDQHALAELQNNLQGLLVQAEESVTNEEMQADLVMAQYEYGMQAEYEATKTEGQTFAEWLMLNDPENYQAIHGAYFASAAYLDLYRETLAKIQAGDFSDQDYLAFQDRGYRLDITFFNPNRTSSYHPDIAAQFSQLMSHESLKQIEDLGVKPIIANNYINLSPIQPGWKLNEPTVLHYAYFLAENYLDLVLIVALILIFFTSIGEERGRQYHLDWYFTQPLPRQQLYWSKLCFNALTIMGSFLVIGLVSILVPSLLAGWGQADYPVVEFVSHQLGNQADFAGHFASHEGVYFHFRSLGDYVWQHSLLVLAAAIFLVTWVYAVGLFVANRWQALIVGLISAAGLAWFSRSNLEASWQVYNPFVYLNTRDVSDGWLNALANQNAYTPLAGCISLVVASLILIIISYSIWRLWTSKQQIQGGRNHVNHPQAS